MIAAAQLLSNAEMEGIRVVAPTFVTRPTDDRRQADGMDRTL